MIDITQDVKEKIKEEAKSVHPNECCGLLIVTKGSEELDIYKSINTAKDPINNFALELEDYVIAEQAGDVVGLYHSHTQGINSFSEADITISDKLELISVLYNTESDHTYVHYPKEL